ncbi:hypothetical protein [Candidatus Methylobacter oryzae]|uniref:Uncharacterized protein n=1 Tax=Candidatus Methylobacter oryzae TaxID=2497749 RepID=A0ABY3C8Y3_9GAMM|nr:hypothetical protein [Candidatus Methylobacter oryzae]TRW92878.1 hypothetical protein EKO24_014050 [Candidatus Methylobacter oryzae]
MQAIRQIVETKKLKDLIDIPDDFSSETVEVIVFPVLSKDTQTNQLNPEQFFGVSHLDNVEQLLAAMRDEWEH